MTSVDQTTLGFYAAEADVYAARDRPPSKELTAFLAALAPGARILELGCGGGQDSADMIARGYYVDPTDGSPELAREAERRLGRPVRVMLFDQLDAREMYDGVWANACLLHVPRAELAGVIKRVLTALKSGGVFYASYKAGAGEGRDAFDRYYNYPSAEWLRSIYAPMGWASVKIDEAQGGGYDQLPTVWLHVTAMKRA